MDALWLFLSFAIGSAGLGLFIYGKRQARPPQLVTGLLMMGYPYFVANVWIMAGVAAALIGLLWVAVRMGW